MNDSNGAWVFISHSTKDWNEVRHVRNHLESLGHRPLVFFLKCLSDHDELIDLIKREIEARNVFLLCESENSRLSRYVQEEVEYIEEVAKKDPSKKYYEEINLNDDIQKQLEQIEVFSKRITVYLSYSRKDSAMADRLRDSLAECDYTVWSDQEMPPGVDFAQEIKDRLDPAIERGFVLFLLSPNFGASRFCMNELHYAMNKGYGSGRANLVPVLLPGTAGDLHELPNDLQLALAGIQVCDFTQGEFDANVAALVDDLRNREMD